jgi:hypothetical protein
MHTLHAARKENILMERMHAAVQLWMYIIELQRAAAIHVQAMQSHLLLVWKEEIFFDVIPQVSVEPDVRCIALLLLFKDTRPRSFKVGLL